MSGHRFSAALLLFLFASSARTIQSQSAQMRAATASNPALEPNATEDNRLGALPAEERGDLLMARHAWVEAATAYGTAPKTAVVWNKMGIAWHHLLAIGEARTDYQQALALRPDYAEALNNLGATYYEEQDYRRAIQYYRKALALDPHAAVFMVNLGTAYFAQGKRSEGQQEYRSAFAADPDVFDMTTQQIIQGPVPARERASLDYCLAEMFATSGDVDRAMQYLDEAFATGFADRKRVLGDPAFATLHSSPEYAALLAKPQ